MRAAAVRQLCRVGLRLAMRTHFEVGAEETGAERTAPIPAQVYNKSREIFEREEKLIRTARREKFKKREQLLCDMRKNKRMEFN
jgi:hypothetical protein